MRRKSIKVNPVTRDLDLAGGRLQFAIDKESVLQNCDHAVRQQLGELRYRQSKGVEYLNNAFNGNPNFQRFKFQVINQLENVSGVVRVINFDYTFTNGVIDYTASIQTEYGNGEINGEL